jgi:hypothetical protein
MIFLKKYTAVRLMHVGTGPGSVCGSVTGSGSRLLSIICCIWLFLALCVWCGSASECGSGSGSGSGSGFGSLDTVTGTILSVGTGIYWLSYTGLALELNITHHIVLLGSMSGCGSGTVLGFGFVNTNLGPVSNSASTYQNELSDSLILLVQYSFLDAGTGTSMFTSTGTHSP